MLRILKKYLYVISEVTRSMFLQEQYSDSVASRNTSCTCGDPDTRLLDLLHLRTYSYYYTLISLKSGQEALLGRQEALEKKQDAMQLQMTSFYNEFKDREFPDRTIVISTSTITGIIPRPISKINDITLKHIYKMITDNLRIELTEETKRIVNTCNKVICDQLAALPSVQDLGTNPAWSLFPQEDKNRLCINHSIILRDNRINFTRCHRNWASIARVSQLWKGCKKREYSASMIHE
ncbi:hypothetical protein PHYBLDRAFT_71417 [Phycomyces blakesleeanus NRRL 1555(-)]|uniref:Uncharacterized protein n=1 Tax=Phycomyces blakesleeanus (strain ATCC 8743b / DSM 1359 / FGSC 10004 / NBRC 33097 / NRRL 1555) TaxID=763407 RepID=A0A167MWS1_PHYB8|nr:hypothetical protein PHYBLDRAFT_71417 [Phycomyces blakesleeanus NRRL 1555(-)]OAD74314.1 hypothetical protein PHYBLDRAFT_71417 [Phycomyces blakesleeanus NRRL 1555(-)]|eukprot:XP_018292354.1 hypothetical protein PHYBLDRAFT_71417 [Phycomyces blakesleeanus NRRL 1555(-)]